MIVVGNPMVLARDASWQALLAHAVKHGAYRGIDLPPELLPLPRGSGPGHEGGSPEGGLVAHPQGGAAPPYFDRAASESAAIASALALEASAASDSEAGEGEGGAAGGAAPRKGHGQCTII